MIQSADMDKVALVTGGTGAIGSAICEGLVARGHRVVLVARNAKKGAEVAGAIERKLGVGPRVEICDVSLKGEVAALVKRWEGPLHVLLNNAAECPRRRSETSQGCEIGITTETQRAQSATQRRSFVWQ